MNEVILQQTPTELFWIARLARPLNWRHEMNILQKKIDGESSLT
jgi:hypothetical protein